MAMDRRIFDAFDDIRAEEALKQTTARYLQAEIKKRTQKAVRRLSARRVAIAVASFVLLSSIALSALYFTPKAYIDIDVNPSLFVTVNRFGRVIDASAFNDDGESILQEVKVQNKSYDETVQLLLQTMIAYGYMEQEDIVSVTLQTDDDQSEKTMLNDLESAVFTTLDNHHIDASTEIYAVSDDVLATAHGHNLSPARYLAITELQELGEEVSYAGCAEHSLSELRKEKNAHGGGQHRKQKRHGKQNNFHH